LAQGGACNERNDKDQPGHKANWFHKTLQKVRKELMSEEPGDDRFFYDPVVACDHLPASHL
jgi:hypothetical protein